MQWGLSLKIVSDFDSELWGLPPPSAIRWLSRYDGKKTLEILYHFEHNPQSWKEWQRIASIKIQILNRIPHAKIEEYNPPDEVQRVYTVAELGKHFPKFIKYHRPLYPSGKNEFMRSLTLYCQRLHYEQQLHIEAVIAMALHFNSKCGFGYSHREIMKKAKSVMMLDRSAWKVKLNDNELKEAHARGGKRRVQQVREKFQTKRDKALTLRANGMKFKDIAIKLEVSTKTVQRWKLPKY